MKLPSTFLTCLLSHLTFHLSLKAKTKQNKIPLLFLPFLRSANFFFHWPCSWVLLSPQGFQVCLHWCDSICLSLLSSQYLSFLWQYQGMEEGTHQQSSRSNIGCTPRSSAPQKPRGRVLQRNLTLMGFPSRPGKESLGVFWFY